MNEQTPSLFHQAQVVREAATRAETQLKDARVIWSEGDWRTQELVHRVKYLNAAFETLSELHAKAAPKYTYDKESRTLVAAATDGECADQEKAK